MGSFSRVPSAVRWPAWSCAVLPEHHLSQESKDVVKMGTGLIATLAALVLGLLIASAKSSFDAQRTGFQQLAANLVLLDRALGRYGPETKEAREALRRLVASTIERLWPENASIASGLEASPLTASGGKLIDQIRDLTPKNDGQRWAHSQALQLTTELARSRWLLIEQNESRHSDGVSGRGRVLADRSLRQFRPVQPVEPDRCGDPFRLLLSVAGAMFLIVDLDEPFGGLIQISSTPLRTALSQIGQ